MPHLQIVGSTETETKVSEVLAELGLSQAPRRLQSELKEQLAEAGLANEDLLPALASIINTGEARDAIRLRALETALKMNGSLKEAAAPPVSFNIVISNSFNTPGVPDAAALNPILIPREVRS